MTGQARGPPLQTPYFWFQSLGWQENVNDFVLLRKPFYSGGKETRFRQGFEYLLPKFESMSKSIYGCTYDTMMKGAGNNGELVM